MVDEMFGPYRLDARIGSGGMGEVYRAFDTRKERTVALKRVHPHYSKNPGYEARFRRESKIAARLRHRHVIAIHDFGEINGQLYIDMQLVDGVDLAALLAQQGRLQPERTVGIVTQIARALDAAHREGLVHRDVRPQNVLITDADDGEDFAYLIDFGIARSAVGTKITEVNELVGAKPYMAPERFRGEREDKRVDVYSLGCLLYELLTGLPPFVRDSPDAQMYAHLEAPVPKPSAQAEVPAELDAVVARAMAKDPDERYPSAGELAAAARAALRPADPPPVPSDDAAAVPLVTDDEASSSMPGPPPRSTPPHWHATLPEEASPLPAAAQPDPEPQPAPQATPQPADITAAGAPPAAAPEGQADRHGDNRRPVARRSARRVRRNPDLLDRAIDGVGRGVARGGRGLARTWRSREKIDPVHRRGGEGVLVLVLAVFTGGAIWAGAAGPAGAVIAAAAATVAGLGAVVVPVLLFVIGLILMTTEAHLEARPRIVVGSALLTLGVLGLVHVGAGLPSEPDRWAEGGGALGYAASIPLVSVLTVWVAVPLLILLTAYAFLLLIDTPLRELPDLVRRMTGRAVDNGDDEVLP